MLTARHLALLTLHHATTAFTIRDLTHRCYRLMLDSAQSKWVHRVLRKWQRESRSEYDSMIAIAVRSQRARASLGR